MFDIRSEMLIMFYQSAMASELVYAAVCWSSSMPDLSTRRLDKLVKRLRLWLAGVWTHHIHLY